MTQPTLFISYSHRDEVWKDLLVSHLKRASLPLRLSLWHDRLIDPGAEWYDEIRRAMDDALAAIFVVSESFLASDFCRKEEIPYLFARREKDGIFLFPILVEKCSWKRYHWLRVLQMLPRDGKALSEFPGEEDTILTEVSEHLRRRLADPAYRPPATLATTERPLAVDTTHLPATGFRLFGREGDLSLLNTHWRSYNTNVVCFESPGGAGKTTLVSEWLREIEREGYHGATRVFGWSFSGQGMEPGTVSADLFLEAALRFFGAKEVGSESRWDRGTLLARLVGQRKNLLILDGLEPFQTGVQYEVGHLVDPDLRALLAGLAQKNNGLCVVTTRAHLADLEAFPETVQMRRLEYLLPEAGTSLLRVGGASGSDDEIARRVLELGGHTLALALLVALMRIRKTTVVPKLTARAKLPVHDAPLRVLEAIAEELHDSAEMDLLKVLSLFDRSAEKGALEVLRARPPIPRLTDHLSRLDEGEWQVLLRDLRRVGLLAKESEHDPEAVDYHPTLREYFARILSEQPLAFQEAHRRLSHYYQATTRDQPISFEEMEPLYLAVIHGCRGGRCQEALDDLFYRRIQRGVSSYNVQVLGAFGADLAMVAEFFRGGWNELKDIKAADRDYVFNCAGYDLMALGRLEEAEQTMLAAQRTAVSLGRWREAGVSAANLVDNQTLRGRLDEARQHALAGVEFAEKSGDLAMLLMQRAGIGAALHNLWRLEEARGWFEQAEKVQRKVDSRRIFLYSQQGFTYCELLLDLDKFDDVILQATAALKVALAEHWESDAALARLSLGCASMLKGNIDEAERYVGMAIDGLRKYGRIDSILRGLLVRSEVYRWQGRLEESELDIEEVKTTAEYRNLVLYQLLAAVAAFRLNAQRLDAVRARKHGLEARRLNEKIGYRNLSTQIEQIEEELVRRL
jgi:tetratricopeptide (TPR) repeat protein